MVNDPIGDFIVRLKNASDVGLSHVVLPYSKLKHAVADTLAASGFVGTVRKEGKDARKTLAVDLVYTNGTPKISGVKRISKPGRRMYASVKEINPVKYGKGLLVLSTPKGIMTGGQARKEGVGGETLFEIF
ncbi:MAG: 30S ribosomal protein S8 [Minisyncoccia bacterium]